MKDYGSLRERLGISLTPRYRYDEQVDLLLLTSSIFTKVRSMSLAEAVRNVMEVWPEKDRTQARIMCFQQRHVIDITTIREIYEKPDFPRHQDNEKG